MFGCYCLCTAEGLSRPFPVEVAPWPSWLFSDTSQAPSLVSLPWSLVPVGTVRGCGVFQPFSPHWASGLSGAETIFHLQPSCPAEHPAYGNDSLSRLSGREAVQGTSRLLKASSFCLLRAACLCPQNLLLKSQPPRVMVLGGEALRVIRSAVDPQDWN